MESVKDRLTMFYKSKGLSKSKFENMCGFSNGYLNQLRHSPSNEKLERIYLNFPELNKTWLLTGEGEMTIKKDAEKDEPVGIPVYEDSHFGCSPSGFTGSLETRKADDYLLVPGLVKDGRTFIVRARGESMVNKNNPEMSIPNGAYVAVQKSTLSTPQWGETYALSTDDGCIIKRLYPSERENYVRCVSFNEENYPSFELCISEIHDIGIVKGVFTVSIWK